eukprot:3001600-Rhodomonas_salina.7
MAGMWPANSQRRSPGMMGHGGGGSAWSITKQDVMTYTAAFQRVAVNGRLGGKEARPILLQYGLPKAELKVVWDLSDVDRDGSLTLPEFCIAVHVISVRLKGFALPATLPPDLVSSIKVGGIDSSISQNQPAEMNSNQWAGSASAQPSMGNQMGVSGGLMASAAPSMGGSMAAAAPAPAPANDDDFGEFGEFESATFDDPSASDGGVFGAATQSEEWPDTFAAPEQQASAPVQPAPSSGVDDLFG